MTFSNLTAEILLEDWILMKIILQLRQSLLKEWKALLISLSDKELTHAHFTECKICFFVHEFRILELPGKWLFPHNSQAWN